MERPLIGYPQVSGNNGVIWIERNIIQIIKSMDRQSAPRIFKSGTRWLPWAPACLGLESSPQAQYFAVHVHYDLRNLMCFFCTVNNIAHLRAVQISWAYGEISGPHCGLSVIQGVVGNGCLQRLYSARDDRPVRYNVAKRRKFLHLIPDILWEAKARFWLEN